jgi:hypothetical protein
MSRANVLILMALVATAGCDSLLGNDPRELRKPSILGINGGPTDITVPDSVDAGVPFEVGIRSYGFGCRTLGETPTVVQALIAQVAPYDLERVNDACPAVIQTFDHRATLTLSTPGAAQVVILGVREPEHTQLTVSRTVVVRP